MEGMKVPGGPWVRDVGDYGLGLEELSSMNRTLQTMTEDLSLSANRVASNVLEEIDRIDDNIRRIETLLRTVAIPLDRS